MIGEPAVNAAISTGVDTGMDKLDSFSGLDECIFCLGQMRRARRAEIEAKLMTVSAEFRAAVEQHRGTWYICPSCGLKSCVKWG